MLYWIVLRVKPPEALLQPNKICMNNVVEFLVLFADKAKNDMLIFPLGTKVLHKKNYQVSLRNCLLYEMYQAHSRIIYFLSRGIILIFSELCSVSNNLQSFFGKFVEASFFKDYERKVDCVFLNRKTRGATKKKHQCVQNIQHTIELSNDMI